MILLFVHGWNSTNTDTYGNLPEAVATEAQVRGLNITIEHIYLGQYISFYDEVTVNDIARAFDTARIEKLGESTCFSCITHSTGGPVIRTWVDKFYGANNLKELPLQHLIMLAPANHGSALAQLGKSKLSRLASWFKGVEPGQKVLDWLELGSDGSWELNKAWLHYDPPASGLYPFAITGQNIDKKLYDYINSYTGEKGSDGVIRVASANMNYRYIRLVQQKESNELIIDGTIQTPKTPYPFEIVPDTSHIGSSMGIMESIQPGPKDAEPKDESPKQVVISIVKCLKINSSNGYNAIHQEMENRTECLQTQDQSTPKCTMVTIMVSDDQGNRINDYDFLLLAGKQHSPELLPSGFFIDRQKNSVNNNRLTYYFNDTLLKEIPDQIIGFIVTARPDSGFVYYSEAHFYSDEIPLHDLLRENETLMLDIVLNRHVDKNTFVIAPAPEARGSFKGTLPLNEEL